MEHIHMIGIGGTGLSAIARVLQENGYKVTGSDRVESSFTRDLAASGVTIHIGHRAENILGANLVIRSSAIPDDNLEVISAHQAGIPVMKRADFLGSLMKNKTGIAVAGTHGKTTTTSMLAWVLTVLGQDPTFISGGTLTNLGVNAHSGKGSAFIIEADEYDRMFLGLKPVIEIITNIEYDHPDCYPTPGDFQAAFLEFTHLLPENGTLVICMEDTGARLLYNKVINTKQRVITYGLESTTEDGTVSLDSYCKNLSPTPHAGFSCKAQIMGDNVNFTLLVPGKHNVRNALAVLSVVKLLGLPLSPAASALEQFRGVGRRFEICGDAGGIIVIDDYAHHPTEIKATLAAARTMYPDQRLWAIWQPHTYSRTQALFEDFITSFKDADRVLVTDIYAAREAKQVFSARAIAEAMSHPSVQYSGDLEETVETLISLLQPGDVVLVLSAGDADQVSKKVLAHFKEILHG